MIRFLLKGLLRDPQRSRLPVLAVAMGVMLTVLASAWISGVVGDMVEVNAHFATGHLKVTTRAYAAQEAQLPNDLALLGADSLLQALRAQFPGLDWAPRIRFGGMIDVPDSAGETRASGPVGGWALVWEETELARLQLRESLASGRLPEGPFEVLLSHALAERLGLRPGDAVTFFGSTMMGGMAFQNLRMAGTLRFGQQGIDRAGLVMALPDAQAMLDMEDAAGEVLGYFRQGGYRDAPAGEVAAQFNAVQDGSDDFAPLMRRLKEQQGLAGYLDLVDAYTVGFVLLFMGAMSVVLWNMGMIAGLRRYQEYGIRLALGESKWQLYRVLLLEALLVGTAGSLLGTLLGLAAAWPLATYGIDLSDSLQGATMLMPSVFKAKITPLVCLIGFVPGIGATVVGSALSGSAIFRRQTASLFKELEV